jgi:16S rRNA (guanine527-N7)-methyltransferase
VFLPFGTLNSVGTGFIGAVRANEAAFGLELADEVIGRLADHYDLVMEHNPLLHLVGPTSADEFAVRHVLESLTMLEFMPVGARFADVGSGAGFPAIPCLLARDDLHGFLIESKEKKAGFLRTVIAECEIGDRAVVINRQFSETPRPRVSCVSARALDKFTQHLSKLIKWSGDCTYLFFGGPALRDEMRRQGLSIKQERLMPMSEQRYLFVAKRPSAAV